MTRLAYGILLLVGTVVSWICLTPRLAELLTKVSEREDELGKVEMVWKFRFLSYVEVKPLVDLKS